MHRILAAMLLTGSTMASAAHAATFTVTIPDRPSEYIGTGDASVTYDGVTFSTSTAYGSTFLFNVGPSSGANPRVISSQQATAGIPNLLVTLPELATNITIKYGTFLGSTVNFLVSSGANMVLGSSSSAGYTFPDSFIFNGPVQSVLLTTSDSTLNIGSVSYTLSEPSDAPEPATWAMFIGGFGLIGATMRRRQRMNMRVA
jgi:hypothetical protein